MPLNFRQSLTTFIFLVSISTLLIEYILSWYKKVFILSDIAFNLIDFYNRALTMFLNPEPISNYITKPKYIIHFIIYMCE